MKKLTSFLFALGCVSSLLAQQRPAITGIAQVRLYATSPAASDAFYAKVLGLEQTRSGNSDVYFVNDLQSIALSPLPIPAPPTRMEAVVFRTRDAAALQKVMTDHAIKIVQPLAHGTFAVHDPEGNLILFTESQTHPTGASSQATSQRMIHAGLVVKDRDAEDRFYRDLLGFHLYWQGGSKDGRLDYVAMQVPDGTDWLEYMLNVPADANAHQLGGADHLSLGVTHMSDAVAALQRNGCQGENCAKTQMGRDGKVQLNLFDPDLTRVEYMEYSPSGTTCCSPIVGKTPKDKEDR
jgi:catechol 2,3-dioxygenase-like lactoylglutathione lyase family enzyme